MNRTPLDTSFSKLQFFCSREKTIIGKCFHRKRKTYLYWNRKFNLQCLRVVRVTSSASPTSWCVYQWYAESSIFTGIFAHAHTLESVSSITNAQDAACYKMCSQNCEKRILVWSQPVCPFVCLPVLMEQLGSHWTDFCKIQFSLKADKYNWSFNWRPIYIYDNILLNSSSDEKCFGQDL